MGVRSGQVSARYRHKVCHRHPKAPQICRGAHARVPTGGTIGTGTGRTLGVGIGGTAGGLGGGMSRVPEQTGICRHCPIVQSHRQTQDAHARLGRKIRASRLRIALGRSIRTHKGTGATAEKIGLPA